jgi:lambda family phage portal protein
MKIWPFSRSKKEIPGVQVRGYREIASVGGGINGDWPVSQIGDDADMWQNAWALTSRVRDLFRSNPLYQTYRETLWANVYGSEGIMLRSRVKEQEDRVIYTPEEKAAIRAHDARQDRVRAHFAKRDGREFTPTSRPWQGSNGSSRAQVKVGEPDIFARALIERKWQEWQRAEFCDVRGTRNYKTLRQLRLIAAVRDGDFFIRLIRDPKVNKFGFSLQLINAEWCDRFANCTLQNGNVVRMGIEYEFGSWGLGRAVAYYFIKRQPTDWQFTIGGAFGYGGVNGQLHDRVPANEILHYARPVESDSTRPAPWVATTIPKARQLDQYELAEVVAARQQATKTGWLYSDVLPEGGNAGFTVDPKTGLPAQEMGPGDIGALPWGVKYQAIDPTHPNGNFENFRKAMLRSQCAGMPGANYSTMASDYEAINFSAGRLQKLDSNEMFKLIQTFDIDYAERPIFEAWLEMALTTGAIPLPLAKFDKFNNAIFQGRRWQGVDEVKEVNAAALRVANHMSSLNRECADNGDDFEEVMFERAEEIMLQESLGIDPALTVDNPAQAAAAPKEEEETEDADDVIEDAEEIPEPKPKAKKARKTARV